MKILIVSDSHGECFFLERAILRAAPMDYMIHLGDVEGDEEYIREIAQCPVYIVAGNNDFFSREPREQMIQLGNYHILLTHGHRYGVYSGLEVLKKKGLELGAHIAMYGHTHMPRIDLDGEIWTINPGSISRPRQEGRKPSYIIMEIDPFGKAHFELQYFDRL